MARDVVPRVTQPQGVAPPRATSIRIRRAWQPSLSNRNRPTRAACRCQAVGAAGQLLTRSVAVVVVLVDK
eukprot:5816310-Prymnesium_polylepis.1